MRYILYYAFLAFNHQFATVAAMNQLNRTQFQDGPAGSETGAHRTGGIEIVDTCKRCGWAFRPSAASLSSVGGAAIKRPGNVNWRRWAWRTAQWAVGMSFLLLAGRDIIAPMPLPRDGWRRQWRTRQHQRQQRIRRRTRMNRLSASASIPLSSGRINASKQKPSVRPPVRPQSNSARMSARMLNGNGKNMSNFNKPSETYRNRSGRRRTA